MTFHTLTEWLCWGSERDGRRQCTGLRVSEHVNDVDLLLQIVENHNNLGIPELSVVWSVIPKVIELINGSRQFCTCVEWLEKKDRLRRPDIRLKLEEKAVALTSHVRTYKNLMKFFSLHRSYSMDGLASSYMKLMEPKLAEITRSFVDYIDIVAILREHWPDMLPEYEKSAADYKPSRIKL